jgi:hypothetical protein
MLDLKKQKLFAILLVIMWLIILIPSSIAVSYETDIPDVIVPYQFLGYLDGIPVFDGRHIEADDEVDNRITEILDEVRSRFTKTYEDPWLQFEFTADCVLSSPICTGTDTVRAYMVYLVTANDCGCVLWFSLIGTRVVIRCILK